MFSLSRTDSKVEACQILQTMDEQLSSMNGKKSQAGRNIVLDKVNNIRELGILFQKGDRVRIYHGIHNAKLLSESPRNRVPPSMEQDSTVGWWGEVVSALDKNNKWHDRVPSGDGYENFLILKIKCLGMQLFDDTLITDEVIRYVKINCLVNYSLLRDTIANDLYEKSHDRDLPLYRVLHKEVISQEILDVMDKDVVDLFYLKSQTWQMQLYTNYFDQMESIVEMRKMYVEDVHKWYAENPLSN
jgi:hypothetical protein